LAYREYETWFIAAAESLRGVRGLPHDLEADHEPENIRGAKEWLTKKRVRSIPYAETVDQADYTRKFDLKTARSTDSFDKCYREVLKLLDVLKEKTGQ
jgi:hypothetical protein